MITRTPGSLADFLLEMKDLPSPWIALFKKRNCDFCQRKGCDWCQNEPIEADEYLEEWEKQCDYRENEGKIVLWWLKQETEITVQAREKVIELCQCAMRRELSALDEQTTALVRSAAETIGVLLRELDEVR